jgi:hypothetical protein
VLTRTIPVGTGGGSVKRVSWREIVAQ